MIRRVIVQNYRLFRSFDISLTSGCNVLVGANDSGKSTLLEAINLALTGRVHGRLLTQGISPYLINLDATRDYVAKLKSGTRVAPPVMVIEVYLDESTSTEILRGTNNLSGEDACGIRIQAKLSPDFQEEYDNFIADAASVRLAPTEYYKVDWLGFSGSAVTARSVPASASVIDPTLLQLQSGVDFHMQQVIRSSLSPKERVELSRQYRSLREDFAGKGTVKAINERLKTLNDNFTDRTLSLAIDISQRYTWESNLAAHLDDLPFSFIGKGEQHSLKTLFAIGRKADNADVVLIEEPEAHLSFTALKRLVSRIEQHCAGRQVIITTHSNFVLNKLGLQSLILLGGGATTRITDLPQDTVDYFKKLPGFDTLRLVLAKGAILVEGPSDELIIQKAYKDAKGRLPMDDGIEVISVVRSHKRFLEIAVCLRRRVWIVTDNDGKALDKIEARFAEYLTDDMITLHTGSNPGLPTLEPQIVDVNDLETLNAVLGTSLSSKAEIVREMTADKNAAALAIFESPIKIVMPEYINDVVSG